MASVARGRFCLRSINTVAELPLVGLLGTDEAIYINRYSQSILALFAGDVAADAAGSMADANPLADDNGALS